MIACVVAASLFLLGNSPSMWFFSVYLCAKNYLQAHEQTRPALMGAGGDHARIGAGQAPA